MRFILIVAIAALATPVCAQTAPSAKAGLRYLTWPGKAPMAGRAAPVVEVASAAPEAAPMRPGPTYRSFARPEAPGPSAAPVGAVASRFSPSSIYDAPPPAPVARVSQAPVMAPVAAPMPQRAQTAMIRTAPAQPVMARAAPRPEPRMEPVPAALPVAPQPAPQRSAAVVARPAPMAAPAPRAAPVPAVAAAVAPRPAPVQQAVAQQPLQTAEASPPRLGPRSYSLHREYGIKPDHTEIPASFFIDTTGDMAAPPAQPLRREDERRLRAAASTDASSPSP
jgi:hypothetical protein